MDLKTKYALFTPLSALANKTAWDYVVKMNGSVNYVFATISRMYGNDTKVISRLCNAFALLLYREAEMRNQSLVNMCRDYEQILKDNNIPERQDLIDLRVKNTVKRIIWE